MQKATLFKWIALLSLLLLTSCLPGQQTDWADRAQKANQEIHHWSQLDGEVNTVILGDLIKSDALAELVTSALTSNPELQQTLLTLKIREVEYRQDRGAQKPVVEAGLSAGREEKSDTSYSGSLSVSWEIDLWHQLADTSNAAAKDVAEQQALYQSARDTLASEVMKAWLELIATGKNIVIQQQRIATLEKNTTFIQQRYRSGLTDLTDLDSARTSLSSARATLEKYRESRAQQLRSLVNLLGRSSGTTLQVPEDYPAILLPLAGLPEQTLRRRPDLKAAYLAIEAAHLRTRVAYKELLPSVSLQAMLEEVGTTPRALLLSDPVWSLLAQLTAPLFQGGQLKAAARIAELETEQQYQTYRATLLVAVNEVEDGINLEKSLARQQQFVERALATARTTLEQYQQSYRKGLIDIFNLLAAQQETYDLAEQLNNLTYDRLANRIDLGLALGLGVSS